MSSRIAATLALIVFAVCLVVGAVQADNPFTTSVWRALIAMFWTWLVGLVIGWMAQKMLDENLKMEKEKLKNSQTEIHPDDR